jgi:hypothetical protein
LWISGAADASIGLKNAFDRENQSWKTLFRLLNLISSKKLRQKLPWGRTSKHLRRGSNPIAWESFARLIPPIVVAKKNLKKSYPQILHTKLTAFSASKPSKIRPFFGQFAPFPEDSQ